MTGVNRPVVHPITLNRNGDVYEYFSEAFYPINDRLFGNEGGSNNTSFTYVIAAHFTFDACHNQFIELQGGDGMWLYLDDRLVIDLGGVGPAEPQHIELDRLSLVDGREYVARMFFAQRRTTGSTFGLSTNVVMSTTGRLPDNSHAYD